VCFDALCTGKRDILEYALQHGAVLNADQLKHALNYTGSNSDLQTALWLRQLGAQWPTVLGHDEEPYTDEVPYIEPWNGDMVAWAIAAGCTSPILL
jgi:hypothetical protein